MKKRNIREIAIAKSSTEQYSRDTSKDNHLHSNNTSVGLLLHTGFRSLSNSHVKALTDPLRLWLYHKVFKDMMKSKREHEGRLYIQLTLSLHNKRFGHAKTPRMAVCWRTDHMRDIGKMIICKPEQEASEEVNPADALTLNFQF